MENDMSVVEPGPEDPANEVLINALAAIEHELKAAVLIIDDQFGAGFAKANPSLIGLVLQTVVLEAQLRRIADSVWEMA
jgi:hypothetical protein